MPRGRSPKMAGHGSRRPAGRDLGVFGIAVAISRQDYVGHRLARQPLVEQQRQDRVVERESWSARPGPASASSRCSGITRRQQLALLVQQPLLLVFGIVAALGLEFGQLGILLEQQGMDPRQVRPDLEVAQVALAEPREAPARPNRSQADATCKARGSVDAAGSSSPGLAMKKLSRRYEASSSLRPSAGSREDRGACRWPPLDVRLELGQQAGHQVDRARELGDFLQVKGHSQVIFGPMQPHPGHGVFTGDVVRVIRLVLVPHECEGNRCHHSPFSSVVNTLTVPRHMRAEVRRDVSSRRRVTTRCRSPRNCRTWGDPGTARTRKVVRLWSYARNIRK